MNRYIQKFGIFIIILAFVNLTNAQSISASINQQQNQNKEIVLAKLYDSLLRYNKDSNYVLSQLNEVSVLAEKQTNYALKSLATSLLADHYARLRQYNTTSTTLHFKAIELAKKSTIHLREGLANYKLGRYYYSFKMPVQAFAFFLQAQNILDEVAISNNEIIEFQYYLGNIYNETSNTSKALNCYKKVLQSNIGNKWFLLNAANNIGLIKQQAHAYKEAQMYFNRTLQLAQQYGYKDWLPIVKSNLGKNLYFQGNINQGIPLLKEGLLGQIQLRDEEYAIEGMQLIIKYYLSKGKLDSALYFSNAIDTTPVHRNKFLLLKYFYQVQADIALFKKNYEATVAWQKKLQMAVDSLSLFNDKKTIKDLELQHETNLYLSSLQSIQDKAKANIYFRNFLIAIAIITAIFLAILYTREKKRARVDQLVALQKQQISQTEERLAKQELEATQQQLTYTVERLKEKNELVKQFEDELKRTNPNLSITEVQKQHAFEELNEKTILTADDWDSFKSIFTKLYPKFFITLKQQYPQFTPSEVRVLALQKLNFSSSDMAATLGISLDSVKKTKQRLRKKLPQNFEESPLEYFTSTL